MRNMLIFVVSVLFACCQSQKEFNNRSLPPAWAKDVIWYQIFVERFNNGDPTNDPTIAAISTPTASFPVPEDWQITPWGWDWYEQESWAKATGLPLRETMQHRRYGGDLQGIFDKLDYLSELGITAIYFNPLNDAPSLHKYDARNYHHIDVNFGPDPHGDIQIIASEDPSDPATWQWTSADKLFLKLVDELHKRNIRVIVDYSWNHTGALFWAWQDILKNQEASPYKDWYEIITFDDPATPENEFDYKGWLNIKSLPEFKKVDVVGGHAFAHPFEGNLPEDVKTHVFAVTCRWLAPDGDVSKGIDGFRLDVAEQVPMGFWRDYRRFVKGTNPDALLVGEIWWEQWPDKLMNPVPYTRGDIFDAVMFYHVYRPARGFFALGEPTADAGQLAKGLEFEWSRLQKPFRYAMMNVNGTHDSPRLLTCFANRGKYKYHANPYEDSVYLSGKPDPETFQRVRLYLVHQFTSIGAPHIWNGDEMGMWGADDPDCRKPLWWKELTFSSEISTNMLPSAKKYENVAFDAEHFEFYKKMIKLRKAQPVLINGDIEFMLSEGKCLMYKRTNNDETLFVL
ncbi:MAG: glycoside hydrolase family 13 protein, partial [Bacteroidales bacterium]|nr:glycoside hydrolase family 13 protein [Bacteroidales bacterium]